MFLYRRVELHLPFQTFYRKRTKYSPRLVKSSVWKLIVQFRHILQVDFWGFVPLHTSKVSASKFEGVMHTRIVAFQWYVIKSGPKFTFFRYITANVFWLRKCHKMRLAFYSQKFWYKLECRVGSHNTVVYFSSWMQNAADKNEDIIMLLRERWANKVNTW
jgi:hypothetical protein